jgi:acyl-CoA thioester hydrolase
MDEYRFTHPVEVRYGDLDPQGHLNNAKYLTYIEQARINYLCHLELWDGGSFMDIGIILADAQITFRASIQFGQPVNVGVRISRMGNKSLTMEYTLAHRDNGEIFATARIIQVAYDYYLGKTITIPDEWRDRITQFEGL